MVQGDEYVFVITLLFHNSLSTHFYKWVSKFKLYYSFTFLLLVKSVVSPFLVDKLNVKLSSQI